MNRLMFLLTISLVLPQTTFCQDIDPTVTNIFSVLKEDKARGLRTLKKTEILRINAVLMKGETKLHKHPDAEHTILLVKGLMVAEVNGKKIALKEGDLISIPAGMPHKYFVKGKEAVIVSMDAPYYDPDKTILLE